MDGTPERTPGVTAEFAAKQERVAALLAAYDLDALLLQGVSSFAWATCGARSYVNVASTNGAAALLILRGERHLFTDNLEAARLAEEEELPAQGWQFHVREWHQPPQLAGWVAGLRLGADGPYPGARDLASEVARLRAQLTPFEGERMARLAAAAAEAVTDTALAMGAGDTEQAVSARLAFEAERRSLQAITNIVATDERILRYRHALPTGRPLGRHVMLVLNARRWGLVCTVTRFVHFGAPPPGLLEQHLAAAQIAADCIELTRPGRPLSEVFARVQEAYAALGLPEGWRLHHQGGAVGYEPREWLVTPHTAGGVVEGQAFVWNPSVGPARSVDTFLVGPAANEIISTDARWPVWEISAGERAILRPALLSV